MLLEYVLFEKLVETLDQFGLLDDVTPPEAAPYRVYCPGCSAPVVRLELLAKGCYRCGWAPPASTATESAAG